MNFFSKLTVKCLSDLDCSLKVLQSFENYHDKSSTIVFLNICFIISFVEDIACLFVTVGKQNLIFQSILYKIKFRSSILLKLYLD